MLTSTEFPIVKSRQVWNTLIGDYVDEINAILNESIYR